MRLASRIDPEGFAAERERLRGWITEAAAAGQTSAGINLADVEAANSLLIALLLALLRHARALGVSLELQAVPDTVLEIADFSGLTGLLPLAEAASSPLAGSPPPSR